MRSRSIDGGISKVCQRSSRALSRSVASSFSPRAYGWQPDTPYGTTPLWQAEVSGINWQFHYFQTDHLGTPKLATNPQGQITWQAQAEAFGQTTPDPNSTITVNLRFPGQYFDEESGLHYNYFRDYDPQTGRYVQSDPIGLEGGLIRMGMVMKIGDFQHRRHGDRAIAPGRAADRPDHGDLGGGKLGMDSPRTRGMEPQRGPGVAPCDGRGVRDAFFGGD